MSLRCILRRCTAMASESGKRPARLFTPGPLTTAPPVREAMQVDFGSRDPQFINIIRNVRSGVLHAGDLDESEWTAVPMQGSGTMGLEATIGTFAPPEGKGLVFVNGAYGRRACDIYKTLGREIVTITNDENTAPSASEVSATLQSLAEKGENITSVYMVHLETTSGIVNDIAALSLVCKAVFPQARIIVDAMSSYGALEVDLSRADVAVTSANKCLQGVPGCSLIIARRSSLEAIDHPAPSYTLDIRRQMKSLDATGQFANTPPTHVLAALDAAIEGLMNEGGRAARLTRYQAMQRRLVQRLAPDVAGGESPNERLPGGGFDTYVPREGMGPVITTFLAPACSKWDFEKLYNTLAKRGLVIYPGKLTTVDAFRIGTIGNLQESDVDDLCEAFEEVVGSMELSTCRATPVKADEKEGGDAADDTKGGEGLKSAE